MSESILISSLTMALSGLMTYVIAKKLTGTNRILEISDTILDELTQDVESQKKVYLLGVLLGNGIKQGIGLSKGKGKFKMEDLIGMGISYLFGQKRQQSTQGMEPLDLLPKP